MKYAHTVQIGKDTERLADRTVHGRRGRGDCHTGVPGVPLFLSPQPPLLNSEVYLVIFSLSSLY